jgi:glutamate N-acetyltransferase/amino-acid N-acetyltransferase
VFTRTCAARARSKLGREQARLGKARGAGGQRGNSNAFTGYRGREAVEQIMAQVAAHLGLRASEVFVSSTG